jgi:uncharacterized cupin superfamily protein
MARRLVLALGLIGLAAGLVGYFDHRSYAATDMTNLNTINPRNVALTSNPIRKDWIIDGHPDATSTEIAHTHDGTTQVFVWRVSAGKFNWFYDFDEVVTVLDGDMYLSDGANAPQGAAERHVVAGDVVFFPKGAVVTWRVPDHVRKIATLKHALPSPIASLMRWGKMVKAWTRPTEAVAAL